MDARRDTAVMPCGLKVHITCAAEYATERSDFRELTASGRSAEVTPRHRLIDQVVPEWTSGRIVAGTTGGWQVLQPSASDRS